MFGFDFICHSHSACSEWTRFCIALPINIFCCRKWKSSHIIFPYETADAARNCRASLSASNICEWALKQVPRNNQVRRNVSRKRWKGKRALRDPLWRSIVLHILSIALLLMISSQRRTDCGMRNISDLIFMRLLPAHEAKSFSALTRDKKCEPGRPAASLQFQLPNIIFGRCFEWIIRIIERRKQFDPIDARPESDSPCKAGP